MLAFNRVVSWSEKEKSSSRLLEKDYLFNFDFSGEDRLKFGHIFGKYQVKVERYSYSENDGAQVNNYAIGVEHAKDWMNLYKKVWSIQNQTADNGCQVGKKPQGKKQFLPRVVLAVGWMSAGQEKYILEQAGQVFYITG